MHALIDGRQHAERAGSGDVASASMVDVNGNKAAASDSGRQSRQLTQQQMHQSTAGRMGIIMPADIIITRFLSSGAYGKVRAQADSQVVSPTSRAHHVAALGGCAPRRGFQKATPGRRALARTAAGVVHHQALSLHPQCRTWAARHSLMVPSLFTEREQRRGLALLLLSLRIGCLVALLLCSLNEASMGSRASSQL